MSDCFADFFAWFDPRKIARSDKHCGAGADEILTHRVALVIEDDAAGAVVDRDDGFGHDVGEM